MLVPSDYNFHAPHLSGLVEKELAYLSPLGRTLDTALGLHYLSGSARLRLPVASAEGLTKISKAGSYP